MNTIRKSHNELEKTYFFTATISEWRRLLAAVSYKEIILASLRELSFRKLLKIYAFVLMPTHVHFIWKQLGYNGKETPQGSFMKYTSHKFLSMLKQEQLAQEYEVAASNKRHEVWQRDSLSIEIYSRPVAEQKLGYLHYNPVMGKWSLAKNLLDYFSSSALFYETGEDNFGFLHNLYKEFDGE